MDCGSQDALCELTNWLSQNELVGPWLVEVIGRFGQHASGIAGAISQFVKDYGQSIVGLIGVTFGFWRWWRYREHILHKRLAEYLRENDARLADGTAQLIEIIQRPSPGQQFKDPLFIDDDLRTVLRERNWDRATLASGVASSSDWQLSRSIDSIKRRLVTAQAMIASLNRQLFSAYSIRGAIAASVNRNDDKSFSEALSFFKQALKIPGHERDLSVRELEAHQIRKLRLPAKGAYDELVILASTLEDVRARDFQTARMKRYVAEMTVGNRPRNAYWLLTDPGEALPLLSNCEPLDLWERLERAEVHFLAAYCARESSFASLEQTHLNEAAEMYGRLIRDLSTRRWFRRRRFRRLRAKAKQGLARVVTAKSGTYETTWLP